MTRLRLRARRTVARLIRGFAATRGRLDVLRVSGQFMLVCDDPA